MDGFKRTHTPPAQKPGVPTPAVPAQPAVEPSAPQPLSLVPPLGSAALRKKLKKRRAWLIAAIAAIIALIATAVAGMIWYTQALSPVDPNDIAKHDITIETGDSVTTVASFLEGQGLIRSRLAFQLHAYLEGQASSIKKGTCRIAKSQSAQEILGMLVKGCNDYNVIMFYPGATIELPLYKPAGSTVDASQMYVKGVLKKAGYSDSDIQTALAKQYTGALFADKPAGTTLEGYVYGQTYHLPIGATAEQALQAAFDQMYRDITGEGLVAKFQAQGLNLYQGITLASIVQRELNCEDKPTPERKDRCYQYQRTIAQIFLKRLHEGATLGSDVTFIYAADMLGVTPTVDIDSPYNTRINPGLPPGPIASPGLEALKAVGNPTDTDYYYFIAGDDGLIYFARTEAEHQANIANHCQKLCNDL